VAVGRETLQPILEPGHPAIFATWHHHTLYAAYQLRHFPGVVMVSGSADGDWIAAYVRGHGLTPFRGSRHKGGLKALREMADIIRSEGCNAGIIADGSRGPARVAQKGAVVLARDTGLPVVPMGFGASRAKRFNSWDRTILPYPFARLAIVYEAPIWVARDARGAQLEDLRLDLEARLNEADRRAQAVIEGKEPVGRGGGT
jgi:lysophospholipid acyltransferase (LPLAT)-like uncharacterized protein